MMHKQMPTTEPHMTAMYDDLSASSSDVTVADVDIAVGVADITGDVMGFVLA